MFQIQISECKKGVQGADILDAVEPADFFLFLFTVSAENGIGSWHPQCKCIEWRR